MDVVSQNGNSFEGWPQDLGNLQFYSPPFVYDLNGDGIDEIILVDADAIIHIIQVVLFPPVNRQLDEFHAFKSEKVARLPPICIDRYWFESTTEVTSLEAIASFTTLSSLTDLKLVLSPMTSPAVPLGGVASSPPLLLLPPLPLGSPLRRAADATRVHARQSPRRRLAPLHPRHLLPSSLGAHRVGSRQVPCRRRPLPPTPLPPTPLHSHPRPHRNALSPRASPPSPRFSPP